MAASAVVSIGSRSGVRHQELARCGRAGAPLLTQAVAQVLGHHHAERHLVGRQIEVGALPERSAPVFLMKRWPLRRQGRVAGAENQSGRSSKGEVTLNGSR